jgi:hypothetical protein
VSFSWLSGRRGGVTGCQVSLKKKRVSIRPKIRLGTVVGPHPLLFLKMSDSPRLVSSRIKLVLLICDPDLYPFQPNVRINYTIFRKFSKMLSKILKIIKP